MIINVIKYEMMRNINDIISIILKYKVLLKAKLKINV